MTPDSGVGAPFAVHDVCVTPVSCTLQPSSVTGVVPELYSSMKSLVYVEPELPPPPYTWLMCTVAGGRTVNKTLVELLRF